MMNLFMYQQPGIEIAGGARTLDLNIYDRQMNELNIDATGNKITLDLFRTSHRNKVNIIPGKCYKYFLYKS